MAQTPSWVLFIHSNLFSLWVSFTQNLYLENWCLETKHRLNWWWKCSLTPCPSPFFASLALLNLGQKAETHCRADKRTNQGMSESWREKAKLLGQDSGYLWLLHWWWDPPFWNICGNRSLRQAGCAGTLEVGVSDSAFSGTGVAEVMGHCNNQIYNDIIVQLL